MLFYHLGALDELPCDIGMQAWHYQHIESVPYYSFQNWRRIDALRELRSRNHPVMLCCSPELHHLESMLRYGESAGIEGVLVVQWEGRNTVQEQYHLPRAAAGQLLWQGAAPDPARVAAAVTGEPAHGQAMQRAGDLLARSWAAKPTREGGAECPRFWSWPEVAQTRLELRNLLNNWNRDAPCHDAFTMQWLTHAHRYAGILTDWAREQSALAGRALLQRGGTSSPTLDQAVEALEEAAELHDRCAAQARMLYHRYVRETPPRPMAQQFDMRAERTRASLKAVRDFTRSPDQAHWPFPLMSLHLDGLMLDACAHRVEIDVWSDSESWRSLYQGNVRPPPSLEGEFTMSFPLEQWPRWVRLTVGGFASLGVRQLRIETLGGTFLPVSCDDSSGRVINAEHMLTFDAKIAVFNEPDVRTNWLRLGPRQENTTILSFAGTAGPATSLDTLSAART